MYVMCRKQQQAGAADAEGTENDATIRRRRDTDDEVNITLHRCKCTRRRPSTPLPAQSP